MSDPARGTRTIDVVRRYERLVARLNVLHRRAIARSARFSQWRVVIFVSGALVVSVSAFWNPAHGGRIPLILFGGTFLAVAAAHGRLKAKILRLETWTAIKRAHLTRLHLDWSAMPDAVHHAPDDHPYAVDLDIVGPRSLLRWLDTTISSGGRDELTRWMLAPVRERFDARRRLIRELEPLRLFRDRLALQAALASTTRLDGHRVKTALGAGNPPRLTWVFAVELFLAAATGALLTASLLGGLPGYWIVTLIVYVGLFWWAGPRLATAFAQAVELEIDLAPLAKVFAVIEHRVSASTPELTAVCAPFLDRSSKPSSATRRVAGIVGALNVRAHPLAHLAVNLVVPWDLWFAEQFRLVQRGIAERMPDWLDRLAWVEAAAALAHYADTHPDHAYPDLVFDAAAPEQVRLEVTAVGHPLLPGSSRVTNDFGLTGLGSIAIITGSNMSGKSTFLRTLGVNLCLAEAGGPVCAQRWVSTWMRLSCCIRIEDSLEDGISYFYAEVKRLKRLLDAARELERPPVFFLIDEIFRGTNNRERLIGSRHFLRALRTSNGVGLVSTHDLELVALESEGGVTTQHFRETVDERGLAFDYHLRPGPCPTTNALRIMAREGLPVPDETEPPSPDRP